MAYRGASTDRISHLPTEIIEKILNLLPCRDAVKTSILSTDWRYRWISMSDLNFGGAWGTADKHAKFINQCLLHHRGPIRKFGVQAHTLTVGRKIERWMQLISKHDIEDLQVYFPFMHYPIFPASLFNCKRLTHLELGDCILDVPTTFEGFLNLKVLKLSITVVEKSSIESLISKSPLIESLSLYFSGSSNISFTISAPKIKYLSLQGSFKDISLENSPVLVDTSFSWNNNQRDSDLIKILSGAPNLEKLAVRYYKHYKIGCSRGVISITFNCLKVMTLSQFYLGESEAIPLVLELLRSAPNLEKLVIYNIGIDFLPNKVDSSFWKKEYLSGGCFMKLKVIEMSFILCVEPEIEFAKFILSNSPILEEMTIATRVSKQAIITRMLKKLPKLPRASSQVAVTFHDRYSKWYPKL